jgi:anti-sigma-K factor RskA
MNRSKVLTTLAAVSALVFASAVTPAAARWGGGWHGGGWRGAGVAAGIGAGLALRAAAAYGGYLYGAPPITGTATPLIMVLTDMSGYDYRRGRCFSSPAYC